MWTKKLFRKKLDFYLETSVLVASEVANIHSEFQHAEPSSFRVIRYVRDGRTDKTNAYRPLSYRRGHNK